MLLLRCAGYGNTGPQQCWAASWVICVQALINVLLEAVTLGIIFRYGHVMGFHTGQELPLLAGIDLMKMPFNSSDVVCGLQLAAGQAGM